MKRLPEKLQTFRRSTQLTRAFLCPKCRIPCVVFILIGLTAFSESSASDRLIATGWLAQSLFAFDGATGDPLGRFDSGADDLTFPNDIILHNGVIYVTAFGNDSVYRYDSHTGVFIDSFVNVDNPRGLAFGPDGHLYVGSSQSRSKIFRFDGSTGAMIGQFGGDLEGRSSQIAFGPDGNLYIALRDNDQIIRRDRATTQDVVFSNIVSPCGLIFDDDGNLYATSREIEGGDGRVHRSNGNESGSLSPLTPVVGGRPCGLAFGLDDNLYVAAPETGRIQRYDAETGQFIDDFALVRSPSDLIFVQSLPGDFDMDGALDVDDVDLLSVHILEQASEALYDVDSSGVVDNADRVFWIEQLANTTFGDADLDQDVDFADFLSLSNHFGGEGGWGDGDFNGDGNVLFEDFLTLSGNFGQSAASQEGLASVPEPTSGRLLTLAMVVPLTLRKRLGR